MKNDKGLGYGSGLCFFSIIPLNDIFCCKSVKAMTQKGAYFANG